MKIIFWASPDFALPTLEQLYLSEHEILAVVTQPDKRQGRKRNKIIYSPIKEFAQNKDIMVLQPNNPNKEDFLNHIKSFNADIMILVAYGQILCKKLLKIPTYGFLNIHLSLLPKYRGASPITSSLLAGEEETGVTIMKIVSKMDAGPVFGRANLPIKIEDTKKTLEEKLGKLAPGLLLEILTKLEKESIIPEEQDHQKATYCKILKKQDGKINWDLESNYLERFVRAMNPWPNAYTTLNRADKKKSVLHIIIKKVQIIPDKVSQKPGTIVNITNQGIDVATKDGCVRIVRLQKAGKNVIDVKEFLQGNQISKQDVFI